MNLHELLATGACARIGGGDDAHSSRTSRSSRLARAHEARITARLHGRRPAGCARERHGSQLVGRGCAFATCAINPECCSSSEVTDVSPSRGWHPSGVLRAFARPARSRRASYSRRPLDISPAHFAAFSRRSSFGLRARRPPFFPGLPGRHGSLSKVTAQRAQHTGGQTS